MKAPDSTRASLNARLNAHAREHWPNLAGVEIRYRANFAYVDGHLLDGTTLKLCRLRYGGSAHLWGFAIYRASHEDYEDSYLPTGATAGSAEEALDCGCTLYLSFDTPTN
jgi:prepilin-type processing-associated H-X9-DG protein